MTAKRRESEFHHTRPGVVANDDDPNQEVWCPHVRAWMTRREHLEAFAAADPAYVEGMKAHWASVGGQDHDR
jgi:hypothetical protein